jgi:hypothetical protein
MLRDKILIGRSLRAWTLPTQKTEAEVACKVINIMPTSAWRCPAGSPNRHGIGKSLPA